MLCANYIAKLQLSSCLTSPSNWGASVWMGAQQHAPAVLHSDSLLGHEMFISRTQCIATRNISKDTRTIGCVWCSPVETTSHAASWHVAGWKCLHLTFGMFFSLHLTLRYFCTHCIPCTIFFLSFLSCAFVAKRNSSYQDGPPCHQHWSVFIWEGVIGN